MAADVQILNSQRPCKCRRAYSSCFDSSSRQAPGALQISNPPNDVDQGTARPERVIWAIWIIRCADHAVNTSIDRLCS